MDTHLHTSSMLAMNPALQARCHVLRCARARRCSRSPVVLAAVSTETPESRRASSSSGSTYKSGESVVMKPLGSPPGIDAGPQKPSDQARSLTTRAPAAVSVTNTPPPAIKAEVKPAARAPKPSRPSPAKLIEGQVIDVTSSVVLSDSGRDLPSDVDFKWAQDSYNSVQRTIDTWVFFSVFRTRLWLLDQKWTYAGGFTPQKKSVRARTLARYLLDSILQLGPTFIKIGQLSSTRSDLFPPEFVEELTKLQDRVPAFSTEKAIAIIEKDLGRPINQLFKSFDRRPIAAASLGQVHRAVLYSGEQVVVKVQRPGLKQLFDIDLNNLRVLAEQLDKGDENRDFKGIYQECATVLMQEIDYINEGRNADRFRRNFRDTAWVRTPRIYWEVSSTRVLTLEYLPGIKISDAGALKAAGLDTELVARRATEAYLIQVLKHGYFHADPHPGNVAVDNSTCLVFYDFGMMGEIVPDVRERLVDLFYGIYRKDSNQVILSLTELGVIKATGDIMSVKRAIVFFIENLSKQTERQETIANIGEDLFAIAVDQPFRFPATFTFVLRAFSTLEGIGKTLNPTYQFSVVATPYAQELLDLQLSDSQAVGAVLANVQQQASSITNAAAAMPLRIQHIDNTLSMLEAGDLKLRVRVLESERADRRAGILQSVQLKTLLALGLTDLSVQLAAAGNPGQATFVMALAAISSVFVLLGVKRVQRLDKFEKEIRG